MRVASLILLVATLGACVPAPYPNGPTANNESRARADRFTELSAIQGLPPPSVTNVDATATGYVIPVTVVVFDENRLFASGSAIPGPGAGPLLDVVAEAMRRDVPIAQLTLLGHTDAVGSDALNDALSLRRAQAVLGALQRRGIDGGQLSTVAIGRRQPIAPNSTDYGRARNRRVEFLVSNSGDANLDVIGARPVRLDYLAYGGSRAAPSTSVAVMRPSGAATGGDANLQKSKELVLRPPS